MAVPLHTLIIAYDSHAIEEALQELRSVGFSPTWERVDCLEDFVAKLEPLPDLILAEYTLPQIDAPHALRVLQERKLHIPFILLSGPVGDELVAAIIKQGADDFLLKDRLARLGPAVADALEQYRLRAETLRTQQQAEAALRDENLRAQQQAEAALRASEARFAAAFGSSPIGLTITSLNDNKFRDVNDSFLKMLGYQRTEVIGRTSLDVNMFANPEERDRVLRLSRAEGGAHAYELELRTKAGESRTVLFSTAAVEFDGEPGVLAMLFDNTDRKQAEQALARERSILQASIEGMGDGLIVSDVSGKFLVFNQSAERILGVGLTDAAPEQWARQYGIFQPASETQFPSEELPLVRALQGETIDGMELFVRHSAAPDGLYISVNANPLRDGSGAVWGGIAVFRDITERKRSEQARRESETLFASSFRASPAGMTITRLSDGKFVDANESFLAMFGYQREEVVGLPSVSLNLYADSAERAELVRLLREEGGARAYEMLMRARSGELLNVLFSTALVELGGEPHILAILFDDTKRRRAEAAVRASDELFTKVFRASPAAISMSSPEDGRILDANESFLALFGYPRDEIVGHTAQEVGIWVDLEAERVYRRSAGEQPNLSSREVLVRTKSGEIRTILASSAMIELGRQRRSLNLIYDITERKQAEQAVLRRNAELAALNQMGQALSRLAEPSELLQLIRKVIGQVFGNKDLAIILYDEPSQTISFELFTVAGRHTPPPARRIANGLADYVIRSRQSLYLPRDVKKSAAAMGIEHLGQHVASILAVPLLAGDHVLGAIALHDFEHENAYDTGHVEVLKTIAAQAAIALENARLFAATEQLARTDALTGIANRRVLFEAGERELSRARRFGHPLSAVMLDIDHFKQVNDRCGHAVGDQVLRLVARCCLEQMRDSDVVARYGGEEFAILCLETDLAGAQISAERLRAHVARLVFVSDQGPFNVTISLGVAHAQAESGGFAMLLDQADRALYAAKQAGRNRVEVT